MPNVYLAGPISHLDYKAATSWRAKARNKLARYGIQAYSPLRDKKFLDNGQECPAQPDVHSHPLGTSRGIMMRDFNACVKADALLVNFQGSNGKSLGTAMELAWAFDRHVPVVVVADADDVNILHPMMHEACKLKVESLEEGIELIRTLLQPGGYDNECP